MKQHVENDATQIQMNMPNFQQYPQLQEVPSAATQQSVNMPDSRRSSFANFPDTLSSSSFQNMFSSFGSFSENIAQPVQSNNGMRNASFVAGQGSDKSSNGAGTQNANVPPFPTTAVDAAHSTNNSMINHHLHDSTAKVNSSSQQPATSQPENGTMWAMAQNNANNLSQPSQQGTYLNDNIANMQGMKSNIGNSNNPLNDSRNSMLAIQNNGLQNKIATNNQMQRSLMQHMNQFQGNNPVHMQQQMHMQFQQQMQQQMQNMQPQGPLSIPHEQAHKNLASTNVPSISNSNGALNGAPALNEVKQTKPGMSPEEQLMRQKNLIDRLERQIAEHKGQMGVTGNKTPPPNNLSHNSTSTENSAMQTKTTTETNMYNSLDKNSAYPNNVHNQFQNLNNLQSMHQPLQSGQPQKNDEILAPHVGSNNDDKGHFNPGFLPQDVAKNNHITPMFLQNQQQQQQHNAGITPFSDGSARYSNIPIPSLSSNVPEEANPMSWKWQCNKDMADRKCVLFSIMKVIENVQEGNNQSPDKISVMAKRLEEFLYRSARSKEEYTDMSTLKKRLHMIACDSRIDSKSPKLPNADSNPSSAHRQQMKNSSSMNESSKIHGGSEVNSTMSETAQRRISLLRQNNLQFEGTIDAITSQRLKNQQNTSQPKAAHGMNLPPQMDYTQHNTVSQNGTIANNSGNNSSADKTALEKMLKQNQLRKFHPAIAQLHMNLNKAASSRTKQLNPEPIGEKQRKKAVRQQQQRLMLLRHASNCKLGSKCRSKVCPQMVKLWIHMKTCRDMNCTTQHCLSSRCVLNHYRICKEEKRTASCEVCSSVMKAIQMSSQSDDPLDIQPSLEDNEWQKLTATNMSQLGTTKPEALSNNSIVEESKTTKRIDENHSTLAELRAEQVKLNQQHLLLKRLQDQQEQQLLQHRLSNVSPDSEEAQKLKKQNFLLQKCQQQFLEDQKLLQQLISRRDSNLQKSKDQNGLNPLQWTALNQNAGIDGSSSSGTVDVHHGLQANSLHNADTHFTERKRRPNSQSSEFEKNPKTQRLLEDTDRHVNTRVQNMGGDIVMKMLPIIESLVEHEYGWIFKTAVNPVELNLPDYFEVIEKPMDLGLVKDTLMRRGYNTIEDVAGDVRLTFNNAILYNGVESDVGRMAQGMLQFFNQRMEQVHPRAEMQIQEV